MTLYLDTSSLVKLYVAEDESEIVSALVGRAAIVATSAVAYAEARAMFGRRRRERLLTGVESAAVIRQFEADWRTFLVIDATDALARDAGALADRFGLRGFDAVHLASFEHLLSRADDDEIHFSSADARLSRAAKTLH